MLALSLQELSNVLGGALKEARDIREFQIKNNKEAPEVLVKSIFIPFEVHLVVRDVEGLPNGIYRYNIRDHSLLLTQEGLFEKQIVSLGRGQIFLRTAAVAVFITAVFERYFFRYRHERAFRQLMLTCGELAHRVILASTQQGLKTFQSPGMQDQTVANLLQVNQWEEAPFYMLAIGR